MRETCERNRVRSHRLHKRFHPRTICRALLREVTNDEIAAYEGLCASIARPFVGRANAELDDLVQEGRLAVWFRLRQNKAIHSDFIRFRMKNYLRLLGKQARGEGASYTDEMYSPDDWAVSV